MTFNLHFQSLMQYLNSHIVGCEDSMRVTPTELQLGRRLFGVDISNLDPIVLLRFCQQLAIPEKFRLAIATQWSQANFLYLGVEHADLSEWPQKSLEDPALNTHLTPNSLIKIYLEFPVLLSERVLEKPKEWAQPALWCQGFKWSPLTQKAYITDYRMHPGRALSTFKNPPISGHFSPDQQQVVFGIQQWLESHLSAQNMISTEHLDWLELQTPGKNPAVDLRLYDLNRRLGDTLSGLSQWYRGVIHQDVLSQLIQFMETRGKARLGHISMGLGSSFEYTNWYWETDATTNS